MTWGLFLILAFAIYIYFIGPAVRKREQARDKAIEDGTFKESKVEKKVNQFIDEHVNKPGDRAPQNLKEEFKKVGTDIKDVINRFKG